MAVSQERLASKKGDCRGARALCNDRRVAITKLEKAASSYFWPSIRSKTSGESRQFSRTLT